MKLEKIKHPNPNLIINPFSILLKEAL